MPNSHHLYEIVLESPQMWLKLQASCWSEEQATAFFKCRFGGHAPHLAERPDLIYVTFSFQVPRKLSERSEHILPCSEYIDNWEDIQERLPAGWEDQEFRVVDGPYPWCDTLSEGCDCHGIKGNLGAVCCSDLGSHDESDKRASKSPNIRHREYVKQMHRTLTIRQNTQRADRASRPNVQHPTPAPEGIYCEIDRRFHAYSKQVKQKVEAHMIAISLQVSTWDNEARQKTLAHIPTLKNHYLRQYQLEECARRYAAGTSEIPDVIYKYIPRSRLDQGAPRVLRATQILALNDDMECNITVMNDTDMDILDYLDLVQSKLQQHLDITISNEELSERALRHGNMKLSPFFQEYLNQYVGVVSFGTDFLVPTMWSHYANNTGIVVGYDTKALRGLGIELRTVQYSEWAPTYTPDTDDTIRMYVTDRERIERNRLSGVPQEGTPISTTADIAKIGAGWKALSRMLFVKGRSWEYEKEVRLLVDLQDAQDTGKNHDGWPVKVIDLPPYAIKEIYGGDHTAPSDIERAVEIARGEHRKGLFEGRVTSDGFRMQKTVGTRH